MSSVTSNKISKTGEYILTASLPVGCTCDPEAPCLRRKECYGLRGNMRFPSYKEKMERNLKLYKERPDLYFSSIDTDLTMVQYKYFRWFVTGDIPEKEFFSDIIVELAKRHPKTRFLCFTKKYAFVDSWLNTHKSLPSNLNVVYSCWGSFMPDNPHDLPRTFVRYKENSPYVKENEFIPGNAKECEGKCDGCLKCWYLKNGESVVFNKH